MNQRPASAGARLRARMAQGPLLMPGIFNPLSARLAIRHGAEGLYLAGSATVNSMLGLPDIALITQTEMAQAAAWVTQVTDIPVVADADTGYGDALNTSRTITVMEQAGLAGVHLEDQTSPKRCGHLDGKSLIPPDAMAAKIRAAAETRRDPDFVLIARTDARGVEGLDAAMDRARRYVAAGADVIFPEGLNSEAEFATFRAGVPGVPLLANMTEFGKTPLISFDRFAQLGYALVIFPNAAFRAMLKTVDEVYAELMATGTQAGMMDRMRTRAELYDILDYNGYAQRDGGWAKGD